MEYAVSTVFKATDAVSVVFNKMGRQAGVFGDNADKAFNRASRAGSRFGDIVKGILFTDILKGGLNQLRRGLSATATEFIAYDDAITSASAKFKDLDLTTKAGMSTLGELKLLARELGATTEFTATQAAGGLEFLAMAGFTTAQAIKLLPGVVDLATSANTDLANATDIASDSLGAFNLMVDDTTQLTLNLARINDVFAKTARTANTDIDLLFEAVGKGASQFEKSGQSVETFAAIAGVAAGSALKGTEAGTAMRNVMLRLTDPTIEAAAALEMLGVTVEDGSGNFRDLIDIIADIEKGTKGLGDVERGAALARIFGARTINLVNILLSKGSAGLREYRESLIDSAGESKTMADIIRDSLGNQLASLRSAALELGFKFFDTFDGKIKPAIQGLTTWLREIDFDSVRDNVMGFIDVLVKMKGLFYGIAAGIIAYNAAFILFAVGSKVVFLWKLVAGLKATGAAMALLNIAMAANPIAVVAVAIGALVAGVILLRDNWDAVIAGFKSGFGLFNKVAGFFGGGTVVERQVERQAPNVASVAAQRVRFDGNLNINGAPPGSTIESETIGAPAVRVELAGRNA